MISYIRGISRIKRIEFCFRVFNRRLHITPITSPFRGYEELYRASLSNPEEFWNEIAQGVSWMKPYERVLDDSRSPFTKWFVGGLLNSSYNALDRHVWNGTGDRTAVMYDSPVTNKRLKISYKDLLNRVSKFAHALTSLGVTKGDVVLIYLPMIPDAIVGMLACARIGAVHNVVFGGFASSELAKRIDHSRSKVVLSTSVGVEPSRVVNYKAILDQAISLCSHKPKHCVIIQREGFDSAHLIQGRDFDWTEIEDKAQFHDPVPVESDHPAYLLYTSGTTGFPKGVVRPTGGHTVILPWTMKAIYDISPNDVWWAASDFGWVVGHSYSCYAPLLNGNTTVIYEGKPVGTPDAMQFFRVIKDYSVRSMFVAPTALRVISRELPHAEKMLENTSFKYLFSAGEALDKVTRGWAEKAFGTPVLDHWWQTETGYSITTTCAGLVPKSATLEGKGSGKPFVGFDIRVLSENGAEVSPGELGRIVSKLPLPPGCFSSLYEADDKFRDIYFTRFKGYYDTMDAGYMTEDGSVFVLTRDDDVINVAGHRLSTLAIEEAMMTHEDVIEAAAVGVKDEIKGEIPFGLFVLRKECLKSHDDIAIEVIRFVREKIGPVAAFNKCASVPGLPKTRSGKIPRKSFSNIGNDVNIVVSPTVEDPSLYEGIVEAFKKFGYASNVTFPFKLKNEE